MELAQVFGVSNAKEIITKVKDAVGNWENYGMEAGVHKKSIKRITKILRIVK